jgi:hypothetical protein
MKNNREINSALLKYLLLPTVFLTVALLGGVRLPVDGSGFLFTRPSLITLILAAMLMLLFIKGDLIRVQSWLSLDHTPLVNLSSSLTIATIYVASAQAFNSVLPEKGLFHWIFSFFFLWTLWNDLFSTFDARRLLRSLSVLFGTAFVLKHMVLASLFSPEGSWSKRLAAILLEGISLGTIEYDPLAPSSGYISFLTIALFVSGLVALSYLFHMDEDENRVEQIIRSFERLSAGERALVQQVLTNEDEATTLQLKQK